MTYLLSGPRGWMRSATLIFGCLVAANFLPAQPAATGIITGHVYNPATKDYVRNAEVRLVGTTQVDYTESDGSFSFAGVRAGPATVTVSFAGYNTVNDSFTVTAGQTAVREINLTSTAASPATTKDGVVKLDAFTVSGAREGNSKAVMAQRRDMNIITSVSSDIFGEVMDGNVGEFLKYLPGVDLEYVESEPRGPRLGGMDIQYTGVSMDGMRTASADANRGGGAASRATSFEGFSITSVESVEINRTASPENDADSPAGTINMRTKRAFDRKGRVFNYNYSLNFNGEEFTPNKTPGIQDGRENLMAYKWLPNWQAGYAESFFNQRFGLLLSASHGASYTEQASETVDYNRNPTAADPRPLVVRSIGFGDGPKFIIKDALLLTADWKATPRLTLSLNLSYSYFEGHFWNRSFTFVAANSNANVNNGRGTVGGDGLLSVIGTRAFPAAGTRNDQSRLDNGGGSSAKLVYTRQYAPRFEYKAGRWTIDGALAYSASKNNYESLERGFSNAEGGSVPSSWIATRPNPQSWEWTIRQTAGNDWFNPRSFVDTNNRSGGTRVTNDNRTWITEKYTGTLNARWVVPFMERFPTVIKFGGKWDEESRYNRTDSDMDIFSYVGPGGNTVAVNPNTFAYQNTAFGNWANVGPQFVSPFAFDMGTTNALAGGGVIGLGGALGMPPRMSRTEIANLYHAHPEQFVNTMTPENFYTDQYANARRFRQTINAGYWQSDVRLTSKFSVRFGIRAEQTRNAFKERDPLTRPQLLALGVPLNPVNTNGGRPLTIAGMRTMFETNPFVIRRASYTDWFPSFLAKYQIRPNLEWQFGANRGILRPGVDNVTGLWVLNDNANPPTVTAPNPALLPERLKSYQTRLAYYFGGKAPGQLSAQLNLVETTNFIQQIRLPAADFGVDDPDFEGYDFLAQYNVPGQRRFKNLELNYQQTLGFLPSEYLRGINVGGTYTRSYASERRNNLAPHRWTGRFGYNYRRFSGNLSFIWVDDRPIDGVYGRVWGAMTRFDLSLSWKLNNYATLFVQARNPTNQKDLRYESPPGVAEGKSKHLRAMEEYGDNWIFGVRGTF